MSRTRGTTERSGFSGYRLIITAAYAAFAATSILGGNPVQALVHEGVYLPTAQMCGKPVIDQSQFIFQPISPAFSDIMAQNVTDIPKLCTWKKLGMNKGRICCWNNEWHYMKNENESMDRLIELYNIMLVRDTIGAVVPEGQYIFNEGKKLIFAANAIKFFEMGETLLPAGFDGDQFSEETQMEFRSNVALRIGETGISQLYVVSSLIGDMTAQNWGYAPDKGLVFVDVDGGKNKNDDTKLQPTTVKGYLKMTINALVHDKSRLPLSLDNLIEMKTSYENILDKPLPKLHASVDLNPELYKDVVSRYIKIFADAINEIKNNQQDPKIGDLHNNEIVASHISAELRLLDAQELHAPAPEVKPIAAATVTTKEEAKPAVTDTPKEEAKPAVTETPKEEAKPVAATSSATYETQQTSASTGIASALGKTLANVGNTVKDALSQPLTPEAITPTVAPVVASETTKNMIPQLESPQTPNAELHSTYSLRAGLETFENTLARNPSLFIPLIASSLTFAVVAVLAIKKAVPKLASGIFSKSKKIEDPEAGELKTIVVERDPQAGNQRRRHEMAVQKEPAEAPVQSRKPH
jgi:hypothetical protein